MANPIAPGQVGTGMCAWDEAKGKEQQQDRASHAGHIAAGGSGGVRGGRHAAGTATRTGELDTQAIHSVQPQTTPCSVGVSSPLELPGIERLLPHLLNDRFWPGRPIRLSARQRSFDSIAGLVGMLRARADIVLGRPVVHFSLSPAADDEHCSQAPVGLRAQPLRRPKEGVAAS
jgi:hypothetical protein